eukprot:m.86775 g.86775  ORF g.86775 m.86775 type:complete len:486 (+) comp13071_c0_seq4:135-1592(+)
MDTPRHSKRLALAKSNPSPSKRTQKKKVSQKRSKKFSNKDVKNDETPTESPWYEQAVTHARDEGLFPANAKDVYAEASNYPTTLYVPVVHKLMIKELVEAPNGEIHMVGTMVHHQIGTWSENHLFNFRFNDVSAQDVKIRRTQYIPELGTRTVFNVTIPTVRVPIFQDFPYNVYEVRAIIELSTSSVKEYQLRPNILLNTHDERCLVEIRDMSELGCRLWNSSIITPAPRVKVIYEKKKRYSPKYVVSFFLEEPSTANMIRTIFPIVLIAILSTLNYQAGGNLENSISISFTLVFLLPQMQPTIRAMNIFYPADGTIYKSYDFFRYISANDILIMTLFTGLVLASLNVQLPFTFLGPVQDTSLIGVIMLWMSLLIPIRNFFKYWGLQNLLFDTSKSKRKDQTHRFAFNRPFEASDKKSRYQEWDAYKPGEGLWPEKLQEMQPVAVPNGNEVKTNPVLDGIWNVGEETNKFVTLTLGPNKRKGNNK